MVRPSFQVLGLTILLLFAGCATDPSANNPTATTVEPALVSVSTSGGQCVDDPRHGFDIESEPASNGSELVSVAGNVTVPGAHYTVAEGSPTLAQTGPRAYRLDVNTTESTKKPAKTCEMGGIVHYEATIRVPDTDSFDLVIRHDGHPVTGVGSDRET
ncbi:MAG: hypothetical protein ABEJ84_02530 [Halodesulfurarchaeum sp.]